VIFLRSMIAPHLETEASYDDLRVHRQFKLLIEGCRVSAVLKGMAKNIFEAMNTGIIDHTWQPDYGKLYEFL